MSESAEGRNLLSTLVQRSLHNGMLIVITSVSKPIIVQRMQRSLLQMLKSSLGLSVVHSTSLTGVASSSLSLNHTHEPMKAEQLPCFCRRFRVLVPSSMAPFFLKKLENCAYLGPYVIFLSYINEINHW